ncbi:cofactor FMO1 FAD enzyme [Pseudomassariella vexata]|uniref:Cofactor FMO1 FAD enzyme n=1 Tax=Pseudomassariella vexata TaxID=1141098 RepID=A0A1Y2EDF1_9PEZI|nr:cofactor FMO1 FAD enzyme [Pseudomassariella vexata]ORY69608.1 cofactor FMO1 FAD enzyme [Pseudomassariella vexata]
MATEKFDVVVVGTGWNGLISAKTYLDFAPKANLVLLDDQASIGGVWCAEKIYPSLFAQIKYGLFEYSFYPMQREGITSDGYISGDTINKYLNDFAKDYDLVRRCRLRTKVVKVDRMSGEGWRLEFEGRPAIECTKLIYASGATSHPVIPSWPKTGFNSPIIHSSETGTHLAALDKIQTATVVGAAKSAYDTVFLLLKAGKRVNWVIRKDGSGPLAIMPPTILGVVNTMDAVATRMVAVLGSSIMHTEGVMYQFFQKTLLGRTLARGFWRTLTSIAEMHAGYARSPNAQKLRPLPHGIGIFWANAGLGAASVPDFWKVFHAGDCTVHRTEVASLTDGNVVTLHDGAQFDTDYMILCTGFDKSYQPFSPELQRECGLQAEPSDQAKWASLEARAETRVDELLPAIKNPPLTKAGGDPEREKHLAHGPSRHYRRLIAPGLAAQGDRSIFFPGFIHSIYTPLVSEVQALWGVTFLLGLNDIPNQADMEQEVAEWNVWSRKRYLVQGRKHAYAIYDFLSYIDTLLGDLGVDPPRKGNLVEELFLPVYPRDYRGLIDDFHRVHIRRRMKGMA